MKEPPPAFRSIPSGAELCEAVADAFAEQRGWVQAVGFVEDPELELGGDGGAARRSFRGRFALSQLGGPLGGPYGVTLSRVAGEGALVLAGLLVRARSGGVSALCVPVGDALPRTQPEVVAVPGALPEQRRAPALPPASSASSFAARVGVSQAAAEEPDDDEQLPEPGDLVEHFAFGVSEVLSVMGDWLVVRDLRGATRVREIASERLTVTGPVDYEGRRMFKLSRK